MARIKNLENLTDEQINAELNRGAKFVIFSYTISIIFMTFRRNSDVYFIKSGESSAVYSWKYSLITLFAGWWGIPFGPIFSLISFYKNFIGGKDVTVEFLQAISSTQPMNQQS